MFMLPLFGLLRRIAKPISFLLSSFPFPEISLFWETSIAITLSRTQKVLPNCGEKAFEWVISSDLLPLNDSDIPTLLHRSSGSRSSPDISFALFSLALFCSWEVLQNLGSDHLPILLTFPISPDFRPNESLPSLNFQKARWDDFAFYFDCYSPSAEEHSSLFLSFAAILFTSLTLNALLTIWCSEQTALFLSLLANTALSYLPTALAVALRPPFSFRQAQYAQVFPLNPAPFCTLFAGLGSTKKSATFLLLSDSRSVFATLPSPPSFLLP